MTGGERFWTGGPGRLTDARRELQQKIDAVRAALEEEDDPEEAAQLSLLLRTLEEEARSLGKADHPEVLF